MGEAKIGDMVHFVLDGGPNKGQHRPALVVGVNPKNEAECALQVFTHPEADQDMYAKGFAFIPAAKLDKGPNPGPHTWHPRDDTTGPAGQGAGQSGAGAGATA